MSMGVLELFYLLEVYLPAADVMNVDELPEGRMKTEEFIQLDENDYDVGAVVWTISLHGLFHSNFNFEDFPNDRQKLEVKFVAATCGYTFLPSASGKGFSWDGNRPDGNDNNRIGDDTSGWEIEDVSIDTWYAIIIHWPYFVLYHQLYRILEVYVCVHTIQYSLSYSLDLCYQSLWDVQVCAIYEFICQVKNKRSK